MILASYPHVIIRQNRFRLRVSSIHGENISGENRRCPQRKKKRKEERELLYVPSLGGGGIFRGFVFVIGRR